MATIDLGKIKFKWQGTYNASTAYVVDDVVYSAGSSYICIAASTGNAPPNSSYWELLAEGGDIATVLTTQGDILYRDASGLQRLAAGTSGDFLKTQGSGANPVWDTAGGGLTSMQVFTSSGTYTRPSGISKAKVFVTGGGGGGGGGSPSHNHGGGGGAGGTAIKWITSGLGSTETITIGSGGSAGGGNTDGSAGQASSFGSHATGNGGSGGKKGQGNPAASGGTATGGDVNIQGGTGHPAGGGGTSNDETSPGVGGASFWGGGGAGANASGSQNTGFAANVFGSGGGGGENDGTTNYSGGAGKAGIVVVEEYP